MSNQTSYRPLGLFFQVSSINNLNALNRSGQDIGRAERCQLLQVPRRILGPSRPRNHRQQPKPAAAEHLPAGGEEAPRVAPDAAALHRQVEWGLGEGL